MPIFVLLVFVGAALLWLLLSFGFIPIGKLSNRLLKDASDAILQAKKRAILRTMRAFPFRRPMARLSV